MDDSALGIEISAKIGDYDLHLCTPQLKTSDPDGDECKTFGKNGRFERMLAAPPQTFEFLSPDAEILWGILMSDGPKGNTSADVSHLFAHLDLSEEEMVSSSEKIHQLNRDWFTRFDSFLRLMSGQRTSVRTTILGANDSRFQLFRSGTPAIQLNLPSEIVIQFDSFGTTQAATRQQIEEAAAFCSLGKVLPLHYELLLRAYDAYLAGDPRNTVIEASTAMEVSCTSRIRMELRNSKVSDMHTELMLKGHQMLRNRFALLKKLGIPLPLSPKVIEDDVLTLRNRVIHGGYTVSLNEARAMILYAQQVIHSITPSFAGDPTP